MYQFFVEPSQIQGTRILITGNDVNHIKNVLRMQPGEEIAVSNGEDGKEYRCGIEELYEDENVDIIYIPTVNGFHFRDAKNALMHHKHVVMEKPFVLCPEEAKELFRYL